MKTATVTSKDKEIVMTREFDAPRDLVWEVWNDPKHVQNWWGPRGFTTRVKHVDLRVGGTWSYVMVAENGAEHPVNGKILELVPPEKIVTTDEFGEEYAELMPGIDLPKGLVTTAFFEDLGKRTRLTITISHATVEDRIKHEGLGVAEGWGSSLDKLDEYLMEIQ